MFLFFLSGLLLSSPFALFLPCIAGVPVKGGAKSCGGGGGGGEGTPATTEIIYRKRNLLPMQTCAAVKAVASKRAMSVKRNLSESCKFCNCCFKVKFGNMSQPGKQGYLFSENLFEPSSKNITEFLNFVGIELPKDPTALSQHVCNPCDRKTRNLHHLDEFVRGSIRLPVLPN